ncbi:MAG: alpha/beta hydrolase [Chitinophagales bacterium]
MIVKENLAGTIKEESVFIPFLENDLLHLKRFCGNPTGPVVFMLHGTIENGRIFYSANGKGLAPFLALHGFDVFVADLRGRGKSSPSINRHSRYGLTESILEEIPAFINEIKKIRGNVPQQWIAHSWGGILLLCTLARKQIQADISSVIFFGTKRLITIWGIRKFLLINIFYNYIFSAMVSLYGFVNLKKFGIGKENETDKARRQTYEWVTKEQWKDEDGFDYGKVLRNLTLPPALFIAGGGDVVLGHPKDVKLLMRETGKNHDAFYLAAKSNGNLNDYDHITMLTHPDAPRDHFQFVMNWLLLHHNT